MKDGYVMCVCGCACVSVYICLKPRQNMKVLSQRCRALSFPRHRCSGLEGAAETFEVLSAIV